MIPGRTSRGKPIRHDKRRDRIEIMFGKLKDWRRVATRITTDARRSSSPPSTHALTPRRNRHVLPMKQERALALAPSCVDLLKKLPKLIGIGRVA